MPYISAPYRSDNLVQKIRSSIIQIPIAETNGRQIDLAPWPSHIDHSGVVHFKNNHRPEYERMKDKKIKPDIVIFATGYRQEFPFLDSSYALPKDCNVREMWKLGDESVAYIGFVRPSFGAIPPLSEMQAQLFVLSLLGRLKKPLLMSDQPHYKLLPPTGSRITYGVDHESYAYQLALDMESAPSLLDVLSRGIKVTLVWALGANFNTKFRLVGPWAWDGAAGIMKNELWDTIERRGGFFGHVTLSGIPMLIFGSISFLFYLYDGLLQFISRFLAMASEDTKIAFKKL
jgi:dimethylaniline monooxygenase (N-oxide forming)